MNIYLGTEECPGCGVGLVFPSELTQVDFTGKMFFEKTEPEDNRKV